MGFAQHHRRVGIRAQDWQGRPSLHAGASDKREPRTSQLAGAVNKKSFEQNATVGTIKSEAEKDEDVNKPPESDYEESGEEEGDSSEKTPEVTIALPKRKSVPSKNGQIGHDQERMALSRRKATTAKRPDKRQKEQENDDSAYGYLGSSQKRKNKTTYGSKAQGVDNIHKYKATKLNKTSSPSKDSSSPHTHRNTAWKDHSSSFDRFNAAIDKIEKDDDRGNSATSGLQFKEPPKLPGDPIPTFKVPKGAVEEPRPEITFRAPPDVPTISFKTRLQEPTDATDGKEQPERPARNTRTGAKNASVTHKVTAFRNPELKGLATVLGHGDLYDDMVGTQMDTGQEDIMYDDLMGTQVDATDIPMPIEPASPLSTSSLHSIHSLRSPPSDVNPGTTNSTQTEATVPPADTCPVCNLPVSETVMSQFITTTRLSVRQQAHMHTLHTKEDAEKEWSRRSYPTLDWTLLPDRLAKLKPFMKDVITGSHGHGESRRQKLQEKLSSRKKTYKPADEMANEGDGGEFIGYMGGRGARVLQEFLIDTFSRKLRERSRKDPLIPACGGVSSFIQAVLVPELALQLVLEDMESHSELRSGWGEWVGNEPLTKRDRVLPEVLPPPPPREPMDIEETEVEASRILVESAHLGRFLHEDEDDEGIERGESDGEY